MGHLGEVRARRVLRALIRLGFSIEHQTGSHRFLKHADGRILVFAFHNTESIGPKMLSRILKDARVKTDVFLDAL